MSSELSQELQSNGIMTAEKFSVEIEKRVREEGDGGSFISHTAVYLDELDIDAVDGLKLISESLHDKIKNEAMSKNLLKEKNTTTSLF